MRWVKCHCLPISMKNWRMAPGTSTVYAKTVGSAAAPTAGLHFTPELLDRLQAKDVKLEKVLLHVRSWHFPSGKCGECTGACDAFGVF